MGLLYCQLLPEHLGLAFHMIMQHQGVLVTIDKTVDHVPHLTILKKNLR